MDLNLLLTIGGAAAAGAVAGHLPGIVSWFASKASAAKAEGASVVSSIESAVAHPLDSLHNAENWTADHATAAAVKGIQWLTDKSKQQAVIQEAEAEMAKMDARLADVQAKLRP